jgi:hypothetical protein
MVICVLPFLSFSQDSVEIENVISQWHKAAADADFETYSNLMTKDAIFIGTDPTEYWEGKEFLEFAKPYFDKGKAWTFHKLDRNIFVDVNYKIAWFDELLDTQMGICRGSGVLAYVEGQWKINHYVLSITIPNENVEDVKRMKSNFETQLMENFRN